MERKRSVKRYGARKLKRPFSDRCKDYIRNFIAFMFSNVGIIGLVVGYTIAGAAIFRAIEGGAARERAADISAERNRTADRLWLLLIADNVFEEAMWRRMVTQELENYTAAVTDAVRGGFDGSDETDYSSKWSFPGAFLYSLTVITTIGYGNVSPKTPWGKVTTILYAIIGMPLFLLYLSNIGDILARCFKWLYAKCCLCRWCPGVARRREERRRRRLAELEGLDQEDPQGEYGWQMRPSYIPDLDQNGVRPFPASSSNEEEEEEEASDVGTYDDEGADDPQNITVPVTVCLGIMVGYICGGAILFSEYEEWNFLDGSYFCFISLSTIGFGDIVPGDTTYYSQGFGMSFVFCSMYLMLGMALIAMCFNLMQEEVIHKIRSIMRTVRRIMR